MEFHGNDCVRRGWQEQGSLTMNPLMSEARILELIDEAHDKQMGWTSGSCDFHLIQFKIRFDRVLKSLWFSNVDDYWLQSYRLDKIALVMFDLSIRQYYISDVKAIPTGILNVNFEHCELGQDTNYGPDTIERLMSKLRIPLANAELG